MGSSGFRIGRARVALVCLGVAIAIVVSPVDGAGAAKAKQSTWDVKRTLTIGHVLLGASFDPHNAIGIADIQTFFVFDTLLRSTSSLEIQPNLATSWSFSNGGKTFTLKLRSDAKFTDGSAVNAAAVVAAWIARGARSRCSQVR